MITLTDINKNLMDPKISVMNFLNEIAIKHPHAISFAPGRPLEESFNVEESFQYIKTYLANSNDDKGYAGLGQYGNTKGIIGKLICELIKNDEHIYADANDIVVTVGSQEAMCLCLLSLAMNKNDVILVEDPSYIGVTGAAKIFGIEVIGVPVDNNGIELEGLADIVTKLKIENRQPRLLYTSPDFSNPTGATTSLERRIQLLDLTRALGLVVLEDHAYNYFNYGESKINCLKSMDNSAHVIYMGSFSKSVYPGVRIGFLVADQKIKMADGCDASLANEMSKIKSYLTVNSSPVNQAIVGGLIIAQQYSLKSFTKMRRDRLRKNRDAIITALQEFFPRHQEWCKDINWNTPEGGFFVTLTLPFLVTDNDLNQCVENYGVIWTPMSYFQIREELTCSIRLSFSYVTEQQIFTGIEKFSRFIKNRLEQ